MLIFERNGVAIAEIPIKLPARTAGNSKMSLVEIRRSVQTLFDLFLADQIHPERFRLPKGPTGGRPAE